ncbi:hypothetical protein SAMN02745246_01803 [Leeuwenhoekiella marinoflava DSM 3653]|uniref:LPXTG-motif cell wall-anchored protein n=2 Tax=Leeuwenhoekiella marinoflava TaxID=988 RepID=A0A4Q0PM76_9FLAO|nr:hypothetical protein DSL99_1854 [Leeuwenhoekiella marinoflava]SHF15726.1 hypothetical protein SAMN02745246_01803 [Leeuwenhoekiella marinoflava DSM 3653]
MFLKYSLNLILVLLLYVGILIAGLAGILTKTLVLLGLALIFIALLYYNLWRTRRS